MPTTTSADFLARLAEAAQTIPGGTFVFTTVMFILVLSLLIFVHEWGHYAAARSVGIRVDVFSIGFGRALVSWVDKNNTRWKIGWLPFGGYVQMFGQEDLKATSKSLKKGHYMSKTPLQRAWVIVAGPLANLVLGFVLLLVVMLTGEHRLKAEVGELVPNMPAATVLQKADVITAVNGAAVEDWDTLQETISQNQGTPLTLAVQRGTSLTTVVITPQVSKVTDIFGDEHTAGRIGVAPSYSTFVTYHGPVSAVSKAAEKTFSLTFLTLKSLYKLAIGAVSADNLTGPLGIADLTGQTAASGFFALMMFMTVITINLCIVNLFPLPVLDGGHLVFLAYEKIAGKPVGENAQEWLYRFGLACIISLALFSTFNDVKRKGWLSSGNAATPVAESAPNASTH